MENTWQLSSSFFCSSLGEAKTARVNWKRGSGPIHHFEGFNLLCKTRLDVPERFFSHFFPTAGFSTPDRENPFRIANKKRGIRLKLWKIPTNVHFESLQNGFLNFGVKNGIIIFKLMDSLKTSQIKKYELRDR